jgi:hypothetical protein
MLKVILIPILIFLICVLVARDFERPVVDSRVFEVHQMMQANYFDRACKKAGGYATHSFEHFSGRIRIRCNNPKELIPR